MSETRNATRSKIVIERTYKARLDELWDLWTTKAGFESWWGPEGFRVEVKSIDARVGGTLHYAMIADAPEMVAAMKQMGRPASHDAHGTFSELRRHERVALTHLVDFLPGVTPYETTMVADFFAQGASVRMVVTLDPMHDENFTKMSEQGFTSQLGKLDKRFTRG
jgi:uncharacterized protein YndB with AHSA1/START domain